MDFIQGGSFDRGRYERAAAPRGKGITVLLPAGDDCERKKKRRFLLLFPFSLSTADREASSTHSHTQVEELPALEARNLPAISSSSLLCAPGGALDVRPACVRGLTRVTSTNALCKIQTTYFHEEEEGILLRHTFSNTGKKSFKNLLQQVYRTTVHTYRE